MKALHRRIGCLILGWTLLVPAVASAQWQVMNGGNALKNGRVDTVGPVSATERWRAPHNSPFGMPVFVDGGIVVTTRLVPSPPGNIAADREGVIVGLRLDTGQVLWTRTLPVDDPQTDWTGRALALRDGRVYASRSGFGPTKTALYALDAATGATLWRAFRLTAPRAFSELDYDGPAFLGNGDLLLGNNRDTFRLRPSDGATIFEFVRFTGSISGGREPLIVGDGNPLYLRGGGFGGTIANWDLASGTLRYQSPEVGGFQTPLFANDSQSLYVPGTDALHAYKDTGTAFIEKWSYPNGSPITGLSTHAVGPDGSVYFYAARADGVVVVRLDPDSGLELAASPPIRSGNECVQCYMAVDRNRTLYVSNGSGGNKLFAFRPNLSLLWQQDIGFSGGGPALASDGTLLIDTPSGLVAYNTDPVFGSGFEP
ncbi:MAG: PQQ-like beta-propeller repeat protein [Xanthomonadaceae bacterium]|jgi:outer membrane protein assembly factor BamB|nr:PQQ-like beta-propeller repeat protein [Xanthomonadaceae bacterium]